MQKIEGKSEEKQRFSTKWGLILSVLGIAIGTGNIWRFPRIAAQNGGEAGAGAFLVAWISFLFLWSIPLIIAEYGIGKKGRRGIVGSYVAIAGKNKAWMGAFIGLVATAIMFYYSVVAGWCLYYLSQSLQSGLPNSYEQAMGVWNSFHEQGIPVFTHGIVMLLGSWVVIKGISSIEKVNKILIPLLFTILMVSLVKAISLPGSWEGIRYLFTPDWNTLTEPRIWLEALTQNAWDTGAAWGLILTYAAYMRTHDRITISAFQTGIGNNVISLVAAIIIFSTVFGTLGNSMSNAEILKIMQNSGPAGTGLTFIWMPQLFATMSGGGIFSILFFLGLSFAAFSSLLSMIELVVKVAVDSGFTRKKATILTGTAGFVFGLPSALSLTFFGNQDFVWGVGLMVSGAFISYAVIQYGATRFREELVHQPGETKPLGKWWDIVITYVVPIEVITLLGWWMYLSVAEYAPDDWFNPLSPYSLATILVQWGIALLLVRLTQNKIWPHKA